jgi:N-acetylneuraminate synthase
MAKVIAEIGINHNGDIEIAKQLISMAKEAGADYVKFQIRDIDTVYAGELDKPRESPWGTTQGEQKRGLEFSMDQYKQINVFCEMIGIQWFASCWDSHSLEYANSILDWPFNKVASAMVTNISFLKSMAMPWQHRPVIISTGGSTMEQIKKCVNIFRVRSIPTTIMHCVAQYPCPDADLNLNMLHTLRQEFPWATIGYSGHEVGIYPSIMAIAMGASIVERHITLDRSMYGSDQSASMEFHGLSQLCKVAHAAPEILGDGIKRILPGEADCMSKLRYWERD